MTEVFVEESGMRFGPFPPEGLFEIERSKCYEAVKNGVKMVEFLLLRAREGKPPVLWLVEAKTNSPKVLLTFVEEVRAKFVNGFSLGWAACLGRHEVAQNELPRLFKELNLEKAEVIFALVIHESEKDWLAPIQSALTKALYPTVRTWGLSPNSVKVFNKETAQKHGLICSDS